MKSRMLRIELRLEDNRREQLYRGALGRLHGVGIAAGEQLADACITGDPEIADALDLPCLLDRAEALDLETLEALAASGRRIFPAHSCRYAPDIVPVMESNEAGDLGVPGLLRIHVWVTRDLPLDELAFGQLDLACWMFGSRVELCHVLRPPGSLQLHLAFPEDGMAVIDVGASRPGPADYYSLHLIGSRGAAYADDHRNAHLLFHQGGCAAVMERSNEFLATVNLLRDFVAGVRNEREWGLSLGESVNVRGLLDDGMGGAA